MWPSLTKPLLCSLVVCALAASCRRQEQVAAPVPPAPTEAPETDPHILELGPLTQLVPDRPTHLAVDSSGNVYWAQETPDGHDVLFVSGQDDIPQSTGLTSDAIIASLGPALTPKAGIEATNAKSSSPDTGSGNIQSIAIDADDHVLFFFNGGLGRSTRACLGEYLPRNQSLQILANTQTLASAGRMGASIALAQGQIIKPMTSRPDQPMRFWLWLHHSDAAAMFQFDPHLADPGRQIDLTPQFDHLAGAGERENLLDESLEFSAGADGKLLMVDRHTASLWHVDENGLATQWMTLVGLPRDLSKLTARESGIVLTFAPVGEPAVGVASDEQVLKEAHFLKIQLPAVLALSGPDVIPIVTGEDISAAREIDIAKLKLQRLIPTGTAHQWIAYDAASGLLLRVKMEPKG